MKKINKQQFIHWGNRVLTLFNVLCLLCVAYIVSIVFCVSSFKIPSDSMAPSLLRGDYIIVDKLTMGARLFNLKSAFAQEHFHVKRAPALGKIKRNDIIVFNNPYPVRDDSLGMDILSYYVKRLIALPGDTLSIRSSHYFVSGVTGSLGNSNSQAMLEKLFEQGLTAQHQIVTQSYPYNPQLGWSVREMGPFYIPQKGDSMELTHTHYLLYKPLIEWEQQQKLQMVNDTTYRLQNHLLNSYTFEHNYYFVGGDCMPNSRDSRYWGLLPDDFVVGRVWIIWKSVNEQGKIRWNRVLKYTN